MRKTITLILTAFSLTANSAFAISGGPWDFNTPGGRTNGTFEAVIQMDNGSGICRFTEGPEAQISVFNVSTVFYKGVIYFGSCFANISTSSKRVTGMTNGSSEGFTSVTDTTEASADFFTFSQNESSTEVSGVNSSAGGNIRTCNTSWSGKITDTAPVVEFRAKGEARFFGALDQVVIESAIVDNVPAVIDTGPDSTLDALERIIDALIPDAGGVANPLSGVDLDGLIRLLDLVSTSRGESITRALSNGGQANVFPDIGVRENIEVFGSQIAYGYQAPITDSPGGSFAPTGTGAGGFLF